MSEIERDELAQQDAALLPDREAMSLIGADPAQLDAYAATADGLAAATGADSAAGMAGGAADDANDVAATDAAGSSSEGGGVTESNRSETFSSSDTAYSET